MPDTHVHPVLAQLDRGLRRWLLLGLLLVVVTPVARGHHHLIGWLPYWLVVAPALSLALLHRARLLRRWQQRMRMPQRRQRGRQATRAAVAARRSARPMASVLAG